jgi:hypothetical protein
MKNLIFRNTAVRISNLIFRNTAVRISNLIFRNTAVRISNYRKIFTLYEKLFDTNVSIYRSSTIYNQNVKLELTANLTPKFHIIVF